MEVEQLRAQLARTGEVIRALVAGVPTEQARQRPAPSAWSMLEVINHLADEEREDFRARVAWFLAGAEGTMPPIDPEGWVTARRYNERDLDASIADFGRERAASLDWLAGLDAPDWDRAIEAPWGELRAGDIFAAWAAHDLLHLRQLIELWWDATERAAAPFSVRYAGEWER